MREACSLVWLALVGLFRSRASLEAEILILRHQLNIQRRQSPKRLNFSTSTTGFMVWRYRASDRRMDRKSDHASVRLEAGPSLSDPRPGRGLWRSLYSKSSIHGHSRSTDVAALAMAKHMC